MDPVRLLLVEDNDDDAVLVAGRLRRGGLTVLHDRVETAQQMAAALRQQPPDIVISDYIMPGFGAEEALGLLHASGLDVPFIVVSGQIGEEAAAALMRAGAKDFLLKDRMARLVPAVHRELHEAEDRHERRRAQAALRTSEERFRLLAEHVQDVVFRYRLLPVPALEYISPIAEAMFGCDVHDFYADVEHLLARLHPDDRAAMAQSWRTPPPHPLVVRSRRTDAENTWLEQRAVAVHDDHGEVVAVEGILRDITAQIHADEAREQLERRLHQTDRLDALGQLAGGVAHDFNNILGVVTGHAGLVMKELPEDHPCRPDLESIGTAARQAAGLARQLLIFSTRQPSQPQTIGLNSEVASAERLLRRTIGEDIEFVTRLEPELDLITIDPSRLEQIILNLVVNARGAMPDGGRLVIQTSNADGQDEGWRTADLAPGRFVCLCVTDTGCGMEPEVARRAFEPFFTTKGPGKGTGLGLATVYGAVKEAGGVITVWSKPGQGTRVSTYLPSAGSAIADDDPVVDAPRARPGHGHVLVVEDNDPLREIARRILAGAGYDVVTAGSRDEALQIAEDPGRPMDLLLSDVVMPGMSARDFIDRVRSSRADIRILLMSGYSADEGLDGWAAVDRIPLLGKPFDPQTLLQAVESVLARTG